MSKLARRAGVGFTAVVAAAALVIAPAIAANAAIVPTVGSTRPVYLLSDLDGTQIPAGTSLGWNDSVLGSPDPSDEDYNSAFPVPAGATEVRTFISPRGQETNVSAWNAYGPLGLTPAGIQIPTLTPSNNSSAGLGTPSGSGAVANTGGDYSLGIAFFNGNTVIEADFTFITVAANANANLATWTFATPVIDTSVAPVITTTTLDALTVGTAFTQTVAATGTAPITWAVNAGTLPAGLSLAPATGVVSGTPTAAGAYSFTLRATNSKGSDDQAFTGTVNTAVPTAPTEPTGSAAGKVDIVDPAKGATTVVVPAGGTHANGQLQAWAWSTPTNLGQVPTDGSGNATVSIAGLPAGTHTIALTVPGDATFTVVAWDSIVIQSQAGETLTDTVDIKATVTANDLWSLEAEQTTVNFGNVARNESKTAALGKITVVDDRTVLKGWTLAADWSAFTKGTDTIPAEALAIQSKPFNGGGLLAGVQTGTGKNLAESTAVSTGPTGALFDADLTFTAPATAQSGEYTSTLTLTLTSK